MKKKIIFLIHDLGHGGAEKVLINLVNHLDAERFDVTVQSLFGGGVNEKYLAPYIHYRTSFKKMIPGNSHLMKLLSPQALHRLLIKDTYDVEVSYLEGPCARVIAGCPRDGKTKLISWIHGEQNGIAMAAGSFRGAREAEACYDRFDQTVCVSETVKQDFQSIFPQLKEPVVLYNTVESDKIRAAAEEPVEDILFRPEEINLISVGTVKEVKGFDRLLPLLQKLRKEGYPAHLYILGTGPDENKLKAAAKDQGLGDVFTLVGYRENPYKYVKSADLYVCSSYREGFSTAVTEALIVGTPVVSTNCSGAYELLGRNNEYGIVTENNEEALYEGLRYMLQNQHYKTYAPKAAERGRKFDTENTVRAVERALGE